MIRFSLHCDGGHDFDGWFGSSDAFADQRERGLVECPHCGSTAVEKALMTPSVAKGSADRAVALSALKREVAGQLAAMREHVTSNCEDVGRRFPEEARRIHYGESEARGIYGEASRPEVESLLDEGVEIAPLPAVPQKAN